MSNEMEWTLGLNTSPFASALAGAHRKLVGIGPSAGGEA